MTKPGLQRTTQEAIRAYALPLIAGLTLWAFALWGIIWVINYRSGG